MTGSLLRDQYYPAQDARSVAYYANGVPPIVISQTKVLSAAMFWQGSATPGV